MVNFCARETDIKNIPVGFLENIIHFIIVPRLPKTYWDGAALWIDQQPVVALTFRYDRLDAFWFTLLHVYSPIRIPKVMHSILDILYSKLYNNSWSMIRETGKPPATVEI